ncbi:hypothetical protein TUM4438_10680 [Shewanella sairae]|uniref:DUF3630 family protein n=1 Tax=Shewanella sairae TaxID=190310 RepID=A0ABQ4P630_9GAMM|nr:hypothetical protein [Shewanella sairae]MCL1130501.1 hypothetical protein [Shewanella sairae]GIU42935.1 hypothetical protein TUM4438_10680 [Shewanella sairae]
MKTSTEMMIAFTEVELALIVALAQYSLISDGSELDEDIASFAWMDSFEAGIKFEETLRDLPGGLTCKHVRLSNMVGDIKCQLSKMDKFLRGAFEFGIDDVRFAELDLG